MRVYSRMRSFRFIIRLIGALWNRAKMFRKKRVYITTIGCPRRLLDASRLIRYFEVNKCIVVERPQKADHIIFISCSCRKSKEDNSFQLIEDFKKHKGKLIVAGCLPAIAPTKFKDRFKGDFITTRRLPDIDNYFKDFRIKFSDIPDTAIFIDYSAPVNLLSRYLRNILECLKTFIKRCLKFAKYRTVGSVEHTVKKDKRTTAKEKSVLVHMRIGWGCSWNCTYCSIRKSIGKFRSKPLNLCLKEYKTLLDKGYRNFNIDAADTGAYGLDIKSSFPELLNEMSFLDKDIDVNWTLMDIHPIWAIKYKNEIQKRIEEKKITHIVFAIQSGSDRILDLMDRHVTSRDMETVLSEFKNADPAFGLTTQIIIGFPSETDEEFMATLDCIKRVGFDHVVIFEYYGGEGTPASRLDGQVDHKIIQDRVGAAIDFLKKENITYEYDPPFEIPINKIDL